MYGIEMGDEQDRDITGTEKKVAVLKDSFFPEPFLQQLEQSLLLRAQEILQRVHAASHPDALQAEQRPFSKSSVRQYFPHCRQGV